MQTSLPTKIDTPLDSEVKKIVMGPYHSAILTEKGNLYTFGYDGYGCLGHNDGVLDKNDPKLNKVLPRKVEFFDKKGLQVVDVAIGERHTQVLTQDGDVFTMGFGGRNTNFFINLFFSSCGALGHGDNANRHTPTPIKALRDQAPVK
jgi:alpha-tubulin suppressor-like RCC1 family protein